MTNRCFFPWILSFAALSPACGRQPHMSPEVQEAMALHDEIMAQLKANGFGAGVDAAQDEPAQKPPQKGRSADDVDVMGLVTEAEVVAILKKLGVGGDSSATRTFVVSKQEVKGHGVDGFGKSMCKFSWGSPNGESMFGTQGYFQLTILDIKTFHWMKSGDVRTIAGIGDEAIDCHGSPCVRVGDLAVKVAQNSGCDSLARAVLAAAVPRLR